MSLSYHEFGSTASAGPSSRGAGQGMCAGIRDAANFAWKLDLVLDGRAGDELLDTYTDERMPHVRGVIDFSMNLGKVICVAADIDRNRPPSVA